MCNCITCGMPFEGAHANDVGLETDDGPVWKYESENGKIKPAEEIFKGGVAFFKDAAAGGDEALAERLTRRNMTDLPYWQKRPFSLLEGVQATDEEFQTALAKL